MWLRMKGPVRRLSRWSSPGQCCYHELSYTKPGLPSEVLSYIQKDMIDCDATKAPSPAHVGVDMLYAPLNPADLNSIEGVYPKPADSETRLSRWTPNAVVAGSEGIGRVRYAAGPFRVNDLVVVGTPGLGTMRSFLWAPLSSLFPIAPHAHELIHSSNGSLARKGSSAPGTLIAALSTLPQLGGTAFRMLSDFQSEGAVIQNAANSAVGFMASQLAYIMKRDMVGIIRRGKKSSEEWDDLVKYLNADGKSSMTIAEEDLVDKNYLQEVQRSLESNGISPLLALNCVGGSSASLLLKMLGNTGTMITYGGMSKSPVTMGAGQMIFKDMKLVGYWHSRWMTEHTYAEKKEMIDTLFDLVFDGKISCPPVEEFSLANFRKALEFESNQSGRRRKVVFKCQES